MKWLKRIALAVLVLYLALAALTYYRQEALLFHPRLRTADYSYGDYPEEWVTAPGGERLHLLRVGRGGPGVILYLHGNRGDNGRSLYQTRALQSLGWDLALADYPGFGKSTGDLDEEEDLTVAFQAVYDHLAEEYGENRIVLLGYSMGSGPASYLAAHNTPRATVLIAPYTSLTAMKNLFLPFLPDFLLKYRLDNKRHLAAASGPVRILHGTADELIPVAMARELAALDPDRIRLRELPGVGHRRVILSGAVAETVRRAITTPPGGADAGAVRSQ